MTREREVNKTLRDELKRHKGNGEQNLMIKRGRIVSKSDSSQPLSQNWLENNHNSKEINADLKNLTINFQSVCNKTPILRQSIDSQYPDIIIGSETLLSSNVSNNEIISSDLGYSIFRKDRSDGYGSIMMSISCGIIL